MKKILGYLARHKYATTIVIFLALIVFFDANSLYNRYKLHQETQALQEELDAYRAQYEQDTKTYMELQNDPDAVVRIARERYYMKNDNEDVYVFEDETTE